MRQRGVWLGLSTIVTGLLVTAAFASEQSTAYSTTGSGEAACVTPNQNPSQEGWATWNVSGRIIYSVANGGGNDTQLTLSEEEECEFATFNPQGNYVDAKVDAEALIYKYDTTSMAVTILEAEEWFGNSEIASAPWPEERGITGGAGSQWIIGPGYKVRYKVKGGYWPEAPDPFTAVQSAWTNDLY